MVRASERDVTVHAPTPSLRYTFRAALEILDVECGASWIPGQPEDSSHTAIGQMRSKFRAPTLISL